MAGFDDQKATQELETAKLKLKDTKHVISELENKVQQLQAELQTNSLQYQKKMKNMSNLQGTQFIRLAKLDGDLENAEKVLQSRNIEHGSLAKVAAENGEALKAIKDETDAMTADYQKRCQELEDSINEGYLHLQTDKDMEDLLELTQHILKDDTKLPYLYEILSSRRQAILKRRQDINKELSQLERIQNAITTEITAKREELANAKEKQSFLNNHYVTIKKFKKDNFNSINPHPSINPPRP